MSENQIQLLSFDKDYFNSVNLQTINEALDKIEPTKINWIDILDSKSIQSVDDETFMVHKLIQEDIKSHESLPKCEIHDEFLFVSIKDFTLEHNEIEREHKSFFINANTLLSFSIDKANDYKTVKDNLIANKGKIRKSKTDYLLYLLIDQIIDHYFPVCEFLHEKIIQIENKIQSQPGINYSGLILEAKKQYIELRKYIFPLKEVLLKLQKPDKEFVKNSNQIYYNDLNDHVEFILASLENSRELLIELRDLNTANQNHSLNNVMKTLTIVSTIFIPLTFLAGIYGMNFKNIPELRTDYGYYVLWSFMALISLGMIIYFKKKKWF